MIKKTNYTTRTKWVRSKVKILGYWLPWIRRVKIVSYNAMWIEDLKW